MKKIIKYNALIALIVVCCCIQINAASFLDTTLTSSSNQYTDEELKDYYEDLYNNNDVSDKNYTDEELKQYYENLYGPGDNDLTHHDDYTSSSNTVYTFDQEGNYIEYVALNYSKAYMIQDTSKKVTYKTDHQGDLVSLVTNTGETTFTHGIAIAGAAACFTYTDIKQQGYDTFSGYFGAHYLARYTNSTSTSFNFRFMCDGVDVYKTATFNKDTEAEFVEIDLDGVEVFQIFVEIQGSGTGDYMGMGNPMFSKEKATPYLDVFDLEFNLPSQVNDINILDYAKAYDINYNDISDQITYETNYVKGTTGTFDVTYIIKQTVSGNVVERRDTVQMDVYNIDYSDTWTVEDFKTPYVNHLYHGRQSVSDQKKLLFDMILDASLDFKDSDWYRRYRSNIYTSQNYKSFNLKSAGIYLKYSDVNSILSCVCDSDSRAMMILDLDLMGSYYCTTDSTTGLISAAGFWAQNITTEQYNSRIEQILTNSELFLSYAKDDMNYATKWKYVTDAYNSKVTYTDGASLYNSVGLLKGKCNGNSRGLVYLSQRLNMKSFYANGMTYAGFHAWTYQQLPDNGIWYLTDKLWYTTLGTVGGYTSSHAVYDNNGYPLPEFSKVALSTNYYKYPSIWATFKNNSYIITENESVNLNANLSSIDGIFDDIILKYQLSYIIKDANGDVVSSNTADLSTGQYTIVYTIRYTSDLYDISRNYQIGLTVQQII